MDYVRRSHSKCLLMAHIILVCKYRKPLLSVLGDEVKRIISDVAKTHQWTILEIETDRDHVHFLLRYHPTESVTNIVRAVKQLTTNRLWRAHSKYLRTHFWKERTFWSDGYFASSIGQVSSDTIRMYIQNQG